MQDLARLLVEGDPVALARAISLVEAGTERGEAILAQIFSRTGRASVIGVTGPPGAGQSSLGNQLVAPYRTRGRPLGLVAGGPFRALHRAGGAAGRGPPWRRT